MAEKKVKEIKEEEVMTEEEVIIPEEENTDINTDINTEEEIKEDTTEIKEEVPTITVSELKNENGVLVHSLVQKRFDEVDHLVNIGEEFMVADMDRACELVKKNEVKIKF